MSRMLFLDLFLLVSFLVELLWRRKNFWAWLATCVGVLVITTNLAELGLIAIYVIFFLENLTLKK